VILEVPRAEEFSPVKNAPGSLTDSPDTARAMIMALHRAWAASAGASFPAAVAAEGAADEAVADKAVAEEAMFEVSPLVSYAGEGLAGRVAEQTFGGARPTHIA
jgi:UDP-N-acetylglucosamine/UDP-N-acetylgalactosamine diphosphorylase